MEAEVNHFLDYLTKERRTSLHTVVAYRIDIHQFLEHIRSLGITSIATVDAATLRSWAVSMVQDAKLKPTSVNRKLSAVRAFYHYLLRTGMVSIDPTGRVRMLKVPKRIPEFLAPTEMDRLLDDVPFSDGPEGQLERTVVELLYHTGIRRSELIGLTLRDVDLDQRELKVLGKRNKERIVPFAPTLSDRLREHLEVRMTSGVGMRADAPLVAEPDGRPLTANRLYTIVKKCIGRVSTRQKRSPHVLRHTFATHMLNNGADLNAIKELMGHAGLAATQVYTHSTIERLNQTYRRAHPRA